MTPTNEEVVAACQRVGIPVEGIRGELSIAFTGNAFLIYRDNDTRPGSALFITAVLKALDVSVMIGRSTDGFQITWKKIIPDKDFNSETKKWTVENYSTHWHKTLTAACMSAIVKLGKL